MVNTFLLDHRKIKFVYGTKFFKRNIEKFYLFFVLRSFGSAVFRFK